MGQCMSKLRMSYFRVLGVFLKVSSIMFFLLALISSVMVFFINDFEMLIITPLLFVVGFVLWKSPVFMKNSGFFDINPPEGSLAAKHEALVRRLDDKGKKMREESLNELKEASAEFKEVLRELKEEPKEPKG